jgi:hypothetical protein
MDERIEMIHVAAAQGLFTNVSREYLNVVFDQLWAYYILRDACPAWKRNDN